MDVVRVIPDTKECRICHEQLPADAFRRDARMRDGLYSYCRPCSAVRARAWAAANPDKRAAIEARRTPRTYEQRRATVLRREYGMTLTEYRALLAKQDGRCAICSTTDPGRGATFVVDHDHQDGRVRGLLCHSCNLALGHLSDNIDRLRAAITYLGG